MTEAKLSNYLLIALILLTATMFIWTMNIISSTNHTNTYTTVSAFNA